jgi:hypothetical protein
MVWIHFKNEQKYNSKGLRGRPRSRWKQQVRKDVTQREGRPWKENEELWEDKERWIGLAVRQTSYVDVSYEESRYFKL